VVVVEMGTVNGTVVPSNAPRLPGRVMSDTVRSSIFGIVASSGAPVVVRLGVAADLVLLVLVVVVVVVVVLGVFGDLVVVVVVVVIVVVVVTVVVVVGSGMGPAHTGYSLDEQLLDTHRPLGFAFMQPLAVLLRAFAPPSAQLVKAKGVSSVHSWAMVPLGFLPPIQKGSFGIKLAVLAITVSHSCCECTLASVISRCWQCASPPSKSIFFRVWMKNSRPLTVKEFSVCTVHKGRRGGADNTVAYARRVWG